MSNRGRGVRLWGVAIVLLATLETAAASAGDKDGLSITVDAGAVIGRLKPLNGVNGVPDLTFLPKMDAESPMGPPQNVSAFYREAGVSLVRTHDAQGVGDIDPHLGTNPPPPAGPFGPSPAVAKAMDLNVIFPDVTADPEQAASYNFGPADRMIAAIHAIGADILFRLGRENNASVPTPTDLPRYANIIRHIVLHYNKGWANGFQNRVRYWEVWNEPDLGKIWWQGRPEQYYAFYSAAAAAVKAADPEALIGGPTVALVNEATPFKDGFLGYVEAHRLPLDFFSWHWYSVGADDPNDFTIIGRRMRSLLDQHGFTHTQSFLDEWNYDFREMMNAPALQRAAFIASARIYMQDGAIDRDAIYRADFEQRNGHTSKAGFALIATGRMARTPVRLRTTGSDTQGFATEAGRSDDGRTIQILVSNYQIPADHRGPRPEGDVMHEHGLFNLALLPRRSVSYAAGNRVNLAVRRLAPGQWTLDHYRLDAGHDLTLVDSRKLHGPAADLVVASAAPEVDLFVLRR